VIIFVTLSIIVPMIVLLMQINMLNSDTPFNYLPALFKIYVIHLEMIWIF